MRVLGVILIALGLFGIVYGGITYTKREKIFDLGPIQATTTEKKRVPIPPIVGGLAVIAGTALLVSRRRRVTA